MKDFGNGVCVCGIYRLLTFCSLHPTTSPHFLSFWQGCRAVTMVTPLPNLLVVGAGVEGWDGWGLRVESGGWCNNLDIVTLYIYL